VDDFFNRLKAARWSNLSYTPSYRKNTLACIDMALRGLDRARNTDQQKLAQVQKEIEEWCAQPGPGDTARRQELQKTQNELV
jgi:hypothetical protein